MRQITRRGWQAEGRVEVSRGGSHHAAALLVSGTAGRSRTPGAWFWRPAHAHALGGRAAVSLSKPPKVTPKSFSVADAWSPDEPTHPPVCSGRLTDTSDAPSGELLPGMTPGPEAEVRPSPSPVASGTTFSTDWLDGAVATIPPSPWSPRAALSAPSRVALSSPKRRRSPQAPAESREETPIEGHARPALAQAPVEPRTAGSGQICAPTGSTGARDRSWPQPGSPARAARPRRAPWRAVAPPPWPCPRAETLAAPPAAGAEPGRTRRNAGAREAAPWA